MNVSTHINKGKANIFEILYLHQQSNRIQSFCVNNQIPKMGFASFGTKTEVPRNITFKFIKPLILCSYLYQLIMQGKLDLLNIAVEKSVTKELKFGETILMSSPIFKFNDYKKKQERNILITNMGVYNLKGTNTIKRKIDVDKIKAVTVSKIGTEFIIHVPEQYDYRYASSDRRDQIIFSILRASRETCGTKLPIYYREELNLVHFATTKDEKKKEGVKQIKGDYILHDDLSFQQYLEGEEKEKEMVRKTTRTLYARNNTKQEVTINDFAPKIVLGKGAFGTVLLVQKKDTKQLFAMKSINKDDIVKKDQIEHTKTQKMILEHVNHPFLVGLAYAFQTSNKLYFIMQFMKGGQLFQHLSNQKKFPQKQAKFYAMQIALGLGHLHHKDFIYRDLKLENVLMDDLGNVHLTDFGMAKIIRDGQTAKTFCGTPEYLAPQVLQGGGYDKCADWWSLGILTYEMMHGLPPFYNKSQSLMFKLIKEGELKFSQKVKLSPEAQDFLVRVLNKNPKQRLGAQGDVEQILGHPWFKGMDREKMLQKKIPPPFKPKIEGDEWMQGFDKEFTSEIAAYDQREGHKQSEQYRKIFQKF